MSIINPAPEGERLKPAEAAHYLDVSLSKLYLLVQSGQLTPIRLGGKTVRYLKRDLDALLNPANKGGNK